MSGATDTGMSAATNYKYRNNFRFSYPVPFTNVRGAYANVLDSVNYWLVSINNNDLTAAQGFVMGSNNTDTKEVTIFAIGYWK